MKAAQYRGNRTFSVDDATVVTPGPGEVRLDVAYCGICGTDLHIYHGAMDTRVRPPQVIGHEASASVAEVGLGVTGFAKGDKVVVRPLDTRAETSADRGLSHICKGLKVIGVDAPGAFQNSWTVPASTLHKIPAFVDLKMAALAEPLAVACHDIRLGRVVAGEFIVVLGGGPIGVLIALVARALGARVVLSEVNPFRLAFARDCGLDVIDPEKNDLVEICREKTDGRGADVVFEVSGAKAAALAMTNFASLRGRIVMVAIHPEPIPVNLFHFFSRELSLQGARVYEPEDYERAIQLITHGVLPLQSFITKVEPLARIGEAFRELDGMPRAMKVMIDCSSDS